MFIRSIPLVKNAKKTMGRPRISTLFLSIEGQRGN